MKQIGTVTASTPFSHVVPTLGTANVVRITQPTLYSTATAERDAVSGYDGLMDVQSTRYLPDVYLGGFPTTAMTPLTNMGATNTSANNYCMYLTGYNDTARVYAGARTATGPAASVTAGTFSYYDSSTSSYTNVSVTSSSLSSLSFNCTKTQTIGGKSVTWRVSVAAGGITPATVPTYTNVVSATDSQVRKEVEATVQPITITFKYELTVDSVKEIDLTTRWTPVRCSRAPPTGPLRRRADRHARHDPADPHAEPRASRGRHDARGGPDRDGPARHRVARLHHHVVEHPGGGSRPGHPHQAERSGAHRDVRDRSPGALGQPALQPQLRDGHDRPVRRGRQWVHVPRLHAGEVQPESTTPAAPCGRSTTINDSSIAGGRSSTPTPQPNGESSRRGSSTATVSSPAFTLDATGRTVTVSFKSNADYTADPGATQTFKAAITGRNTSFGYPERRVR